MFNINFKRENNCVLIEAKKKDLKRTPRLVSYLSFEAL